MPIPRYERDEQNIASRRFTRFILKAYGVAAVGTPAELLDAVERLRPAVVLADIRMPPAHDMEGIEAAHAIKARNPGIGVVLLSQYADEGYAFELLKNGTAGLAYLLKERVGDVDELLRALHETAAGRSVIDPRIVEVLLHSHRRTIDSPLNQLTPRELDVLRHMAQGKNKGKRARGNSKTPAK